MQGGWIWLLLINMCAFILTGVDKRRAVKRGWRIPESRLILMAVIGGSVGLYLGCRAFRHKTKHPKFMVGVPLIFLAQVLLAAAAMLWLPQDILPFK